MERKIMKPFDQYEIDWDVDFGTWDVNFGTWDIDPTTNNHTLLKEKKSTHPTQTDVLLKDKE